MESDYLMGQLADHRPEYTPEALEAIEAVLRERGVDEEELRNARENFNAAKPGDDENGLDPEAFTMLPGDFSQTDLLLVHAMLREHDIPFFVNSTMEGSGALPLSTIAERRYTLSIHTSAFDRAKALLEEHFHCDDGGGYQRRAVSVRERLRSMDFNDLATRRAAEDEALGVDFSTQERRRLQELSARLLDEADSVEQRLERPLFYFDNLEGFITKLSSPGSAEFTTTDLLTVLEVLQAYRDEPVYPESLDQTAQSILDFLCKDLPQA